MKFFKWTPKPSKLSVALAEIHEYTQDLNRITLLRDKCRDEKERTNYSTTIHCMQEVLTLLNEHMAKDLQK